MFNYRELLDGAFPPSREERLRAMKRWKKWDVFFYRSSLWQHSLRVTVMVRHLMTVAKGILFPFDWKKATALALVHDDAEPVKPSGDLNVLTKLRMTPEQLAKEKQEELDAIEVLAHEYPKMFMGYNYRELLRHAALKDCLEAKVVSAMDKVEAQCEAHHELSAGNGSLMRAFYTNVPMLTSFKSDPELTLLYERCGSPLLHPWTCINPECVEWESYDHWSRPHTPESIKIDTEFLFYNFWRKLVAEEIDEGVKWLTTQVEFPPAKRKPRSFALMPA